jgi:hypothetical protein
MLRTAMRDFINSLPASDQAGLASFHKEMRREYDQDWMAAIWGQYARPDLEINKEESAAHWRLQRMALSGQLYSAMFGVSKWAVADKRIEQNLSTLREVYDFEFDLIRREVEDGCAEAVLPIETRPFWLPEENIPIEVIMPGKTFFVEVGTTSALKTLHYITRFGGVIRLPYEIKTKEFCPPPMVVVLYKKPEPY